MANNSERTEHSKPYPAAQPKPDFPALEERVLEYWREHGIFEKSVEQRPRGAGGENEFVFYDGPPFANGLPHYGHLLTGYIKDIVPRYETLRGRRVERRFGWDCHGLPVEMETEKALGISGRRQIVEYGVDRFNSYCEATVMKYTKEWEAFVNRQARWVDFKNDYKTMDPEFMESVLWAFKRLWELGLVYEKYRVMPYSWACETPVSNFETRLDNAYRERQDPAVTVRLRLLTDSKVPRYLLIWTTTPWTLPSNLAVAVGSTVSYGVYAKDGAEYVLAVDAASRYASILTGAELVSTMTGAELVGLRYEPLYSFFESTPNAFVVLSGEFVNTEEGTGLVHMAPGFGEDDQIVCEANNIPIVCPVDDGGRFTSEVAPYAGIQVFDANPLIVRELKQRGALLKHETYVHNYPHCWRTDTPLIFRAVNSWYIRVTAIRDRLVELNSQIHWVPEHIRDGIFGNWLKEARDWSVSRNRFWGTPIPIWKSDNPAYPRVDVYGSLEELERDFGSRPKSLHLPEIDALVRPNPDDPTGRSMMRRVPEVLDCWFESGSMPFAQVHYPFENREWFESHFPADFITEYIAQTRGWFYTLVVLAGALFDKPPFRNCVCHGVVLDERGQKLSKRLKNYPSPEKVFSTYGSDALRWFLVSSPILYGKNLLIDQEGRVIAGASREALNPLWSAYSFFCLYANEEGHRASLGTYSQNPLDVYVLSRAHLLVRNVERAMAGYDIPEACKAIADFADVLNNWYIRRSRDRFWQEGWSEDKDAAFDTLYTALHVAARVASPFLPFTMEEVYRGLTDEESVHLSSWPAADHLPLDEKLVDSQDLLREVCSVALGLRAKRSLRVRLPLKSLTVAGPAARKLSGFESTIADEVNVKEVVFSTDIDQFGSEVLQVKKQLVGPRLGQSMAAILKAAAQHEWQRLPDGNVVIAGETIRPEEYEIAFVPKSGLHAATTKRAHLVVLLDTTTSPELEAEGAARDLTRYIQVARRDAGLAVGEPIEVAVEVSESMCRRLQPYVENVQRATIARKLTFATMENALHVAEIEIGTEKGRLFMRRLLQSDR